MGVSEKSTKHRAIVIGATLHRELKALKTPNVEDKLATLGLEPMVMTPAEFDAHVKAEIRTNAALIKAAGIKMN
jgi:tripartite-type tricarboxylate transporter receptor subunit TctC